MAVVHGAAAVMMMARGAVLTVAAHNDLVVVAISRQTLKI